MNLTIQQKQAIENGQAVETTVDGVPCILLNKEVYDRMRLEAETDTGDWTEEEMNLLADEAHDLISQNETDEY